MATKVDKAILTNIGALKTKYKDTGVAKIQKALDALVASDKSRGLVTTIVALLSRIPAYFFTAGGCVAGAGDLSVGAVGFACSAGPK